MYLYTYMQPWSELFINTFFFQPYLIYQYIAIMKAEAGIHHKKLDKIKGDAARLSH